MDSISRHSSILQSLSSKGFERFLRSISEFLIFPLWLSPQPNKCPVAFARNRAVFSPSGGPRSRDYRAVVVCVANCAMVMLVKEPAFPVVNLFVKEVRKTSDLQHTPIPTFVHAKPASIIGLLTISATSGCFVSVFQFFDDFRLIAIAASRYGMQKKII
jgi:hypothetical protein